MDAVIACCFLISMLLLPRAASQTNAPNAEGRIEVLEEQQIRSEQRIASLEMRPTAAHDSESRLTRIEDRLATIEAERDRERQDQKDTDNHIWMTLGTVFAGLLGLAIERIIYRKKTNGG